MSQPARGLALRIAVPILLVLGLSARSEAAAEDVAPVLREIDGQTYVEDAPIWICENAASSRALENADLRITGRSSSGQPLQWGSHALHLEARRPRQDREMTAQQLQMLVPGKRISETRFAVVPYSIPFSYPAGSYEVWDRTDSRHPLARFTVVPPRGSEVWVRAGLSRAHRLMESRTPEAARLYEAIFDRYPHSVYRDAVYLGLWETRAFNRFAKEPDLWLEEIFAHYHDTCFGVYAIHVFVADRGREQALTILRQMAGIYTDTRMARAAAAWF